MGLRSSFLEIKLKSKYKSYLDIKWLVVMFLRSMGNYTGSILSFMAAFGRRPWLHSGDFNVISREVVTRLVGWLWIWFCGVYKSKLLGWSSRFSLMGCSRLEYWGGGVRVAMFCLYSKLKAVKKILKLVNVDVYGGITQKVLTQAKARLA
jgi:hypothetical protein